MKEWNVEEILGDEDMIEHSSIYERRTGNIEFFLFTIPVSIWASQEQTQEKKKYISSYAHKTRDIRSSLFQNIYEKQCKNQASVHSQIYLPCLLRTHKSAIPRR